MPKTNAPPVAEGETVPFAQPAPIDSSSITTSNVVLLSALEDIPADWIITGVPSSLAQGLVDAGKARMATERDMSIGAAVTVPYIVKESTNA